MTTFSKRHRRALSDGRLNIDLDQTTRGRIHLLLDRHVEVYTATDHTNFNYETSTLEDLIEVLFGVYGSRQLPHARDDRDMDSFIEEAGGEHVFDAVELFVKPMKNGGGFASELNDILAEQDVPWRMLSDQMVLLDAEFARDEMAARGDGALRAAGFDGALAELRRARDRLVDGDERGAIHNAGSSLEGVVMALLQRDEGTAKRLLQDLNREGYFDGLPTKLRERFIQQVLMSLPWMRNALGGHGQGKDAVEVPRAYGELAIDLAAALGHFLVTLKFERGARPLERVEQLEAPTGSDFSPQGGSPDNWDFIPAAAGSDEDIPF